MSTRRSLDAEWLDSWCQEVVQRVSRAMVSFEATYGYPPGENTVVRAHRDTRAAARALAAHSCVPASLLSLYTIVDNVSLPDAHYGYFIHDPRMVAQHLREYGTADLADYGPGVVFGSDGGGILFALDAEGRVHRSVTASWFDRFELLAPDLQAFLGLLRDEVTRH